MIAVPVALAPVMSWHVPRRLVYTLAYSGSALLIFRPARSLAQAAYWSPLADFVSPILGPGNLGST